jgi:hypothetical protein
MDFRGRGPQMHRKRGNTRACVRGYNSVSHTSCAVFFNTFMHEVCAFVARNLTHNVWLSLRQPRTCV